MSWAASASLQLPASGMQPKDAADQEAEDKAVSDKCTLLRTRLGGLPEEDRQFATDILTSQIRETWALRRALAAQREDDGGRRGLFQLRIFEAEAKMARKEELVEAELCAELVQEAKGLAAQADSLRTRDQSRDPRYAHWEEAAVRLPAAITTEAALRDRVEQLSQQEQQVYSQVEEWQRESAAEVLSCRFEVSDLQRQCGELRGELVQAQAEMSMASQGAVEVQFPRKDASEIRESQHVYGRSAAIRWHDPGCVFDAFASPGPERAQMFPADFGHLCERLRRAQGRGPSGEKERRVFADFAFSAVFGNEAAVDRSTFMRLYPHFALMLQELEEAFVKDD